MKAKIIVGLFLCGLLGFFLFGYHVGHKQRNPPQIISHVVILHDTVQHHIIDSFPYYIVKKDTVIYTNIDTIYIDTAKVLTDYFALHNYTRTWEDSLIAVTSKDVISQNRFIDNDFSYWIKRPQTIINNVDNSRIYKKYIYGGLNVPLKNINYLSLEVFYAFPKGYSGISWSPEINGIGLKVGCKLFGF